MADALPGTGGDQLMATFGQWLRLPQNPLHSHGDIHQGLQDSSALPQKHKANPQLLNRGPGSSNGQAGVCQRLWQPSVWGAPCSNLLPGPGYHREEADTAGRIQEEHHTAWGAGVSTCTTPEWAHRPCPSPRTHRVTWRWCGVCTSQGALCPFQLLALWGPSSG